MYRNKCPQRCLLPYFKAALVPNLLAHIITRVKFVNAVKFYNRVLQLTSVF